MTSVKRNTPLATGTRRGLRDSISAGVRVALSCLAVLVPSVTHAQTASLSGYVRDSTGGSIASATIRLVHEATNTLRTTRTQADGIYNLALLRPGDYRLELEATGFRPLVKHGVALQPDDRARLDLVLEVAGVETSVAVTGDLPNTRPADQSLRVSVTPTTVENLPLNGRTLQNLLTMAPGATLTNSSGAPGEFSVNGQRATANYVTLDGVSANVGADPFGTGASERGSGQTVGGSALGTTSNLVSVDALQEVTIQTASYSAEFGRSPGAQVSLVTKAGSNRLSGSGSVYFRDKALDATDWFINRQGGAEPDLRLWTGAATLGGPIQRDSMFFFASAEGLSLRQPRAVSIQTPSAEARARASGELRTLLDAFPSPTGATLANGWAESQGAFSDPSSLRALSLRVDRTLPGRGNVFGRFAHATSDSTSRTSNGEGPLNYYRQAETGSTTATVNFASVLRGSMLVDIRGNYSRNRLQTFGESDSFGGGTPFTSLLDAASLDPAHDQVILALQSGVPGGLLFAGNLGGSVQRQANVVASLTAQRGRHAFKTGLDYRRLFPDLLPPRTRVSYIFPNPNAALAGRTQTTSVAQFTPGRPIFENFSSYVQDSWVVSDRLTLNLGLRWDVNPAPSSTASPQPILATYPIGTGTITVKPASDAPLWDTPYTNLAPRIGAVATLTDDLLLTANYGVYYDVVVGVGGLVYGQGFPFQQTVGLANELFPLLSPASRLPPINPANPGASQVYAFPDDLRSPYVRQWSLALHRQFGNAQSMQVAYIGSQGVDLTRAEGSRPSTGPAQLVSAIANKASSDYRGLQVMFTRRLHRGVQADLSYTWSHATDIASNDFTAVLPSDIVDPERDRGDADFDVRQAFRGVLSLQTGQRATRAPWLLNSWQFDVSAFARSGLAFTPIVVRNIGFGSTSFRPDLVPDVPLYLHDPTFPGGRAVNPAAFAVSPELRQGTAGRNLLRGLAAWQADVAVSRRVQMLGSVALTLRVEAFNVFNRPNFGGPQTVLTAATFGREFRMLNATLGGSEVGRGLNPLFQAGGPRSIQLSLRVAF